MARTAAPHRDIGTDRSADAVNNPVALIQYNPPATTMKETIIPMRPDPNGRIDDVPGKSFRDQA
jgi:hypothetical protein